MNVIPLLAVVATLFSSPVETIVLSTGEQISIAGEVRAAQDRVIFTARNGALYSLPVEEIDVPATEKLAAARTPRPAMEELPTMPLRVTEEEKKRLLEEISRNHSGSPAPSHQFDMPPAPDPVTPIGAVSALEQSWRERAREFDEELRQKQENLDLLIKQEKDLQNQILDFLSQGYHPAQFTYQTFRLQITRDVMDRAKLEVERARRARDQFYDDARRQGVLPGWLR